jgi:hypothetical protein
MNVRIAQLLSFNAGSWYDGELEMSEYTIKLWLITNTYNDQEQNIAIRRAKHFIFDQIENTIFINGANESKALELMKAGLNVTTLPNEPADQLIGIMLFHKLNAIMEDRIKVIEIEISTGSGIVYLHSENETSQDLVQPEWWTAPDLTHCDLDPTDSEKVVSIAHNTVWRDLELEWPDETVDTELGNVVVFADFKQTDDTK